MIEMIKAEKEIEKRLDSIVKDAQDFIQDSGIWKTIEEGDKKKEIMAEAQIRNLIEVASATNSPLVIDNYIKYQMGRRKEWRYKDAEGKEAFGDALVDKINGLLKSTAEEIVRQIPIELPDEVKDKAAEEQKKARENRQKDITKLIWLKLIRLYLGFANRYFTYKKKAEGGGE
jgi:hypothetical protein